MAPIVHYLSSGDLLDNRIEAHKIHVQAIRFSLVNRKLYKRSLDGPYLNCLTTQQDDIYWQNSMKEYAETIQAAELWLTRPLRKVTIG